MKFNGLNLIGFLALILTLALIAGALFLIMNDRGNYGIQGSFGQELLDEGRELFDPGITGLELSTIAGPITVEYWDRPETEVSWGKRGSDSARDRIITDPHRTGSRLTVREEWPAGSANIHGWIALTVKIPSTTAELRAASVSGAVRIIGDSEALSGINQELKTTSGSLSSDGAGNLNASSVSGAVRFRAYGSRVEAETVSGAIRGSVLNKENGQIRLSSVSGSVTLGLSEAWAGEVSLRSVSGSLHSALPLILESQDRTRLTGRLNQGNGTASLKTTSGAVSLEKGDW